MWVLSSTLKTDLPVEMLLDLLLVTSEPKVQSGHVPYGALANSNVHASTQKPNSDISNLVPFARMDKPNP